MTLRRTAVYDQLENLLADRVLAMYAGVLTPAPLDREALGRAMLGARSGN